MIRKLTVAAATVTALMMGGIQAMAAQTPHAARATVPADDTVIDVTAANYQQVMTMSATKPVVLDFTASWCEWCQAEKPYLQKYHDADGGSWIWARVDVDQNPDLEKQYGVDGIPDLLDIRNGQEASSRFQGFDPDTGPSSMRSWLSGL